MNNSTMSRADGTKRKMSEVLIVSASLIDKACDIDLYHCRPTVKQMARLMEIFGGEPSWHQDGLRKKDWLESYAFTMDM